MSRKLVVLNVILLGAVVWAGFAYRREWRELQTRERATLRQKVAPAPAPQFTPQPGTPAVMASGYAEIAEKMLFDRSRNPTVVVELPAPPPPKPVPALPSYHGMMNLGDGIVAVMSVDSSAPHQEVRPGQEIGPFKLVDVNTKEIVLEWDGKQIHKSVDELLDHSAEQAPAAAARMRNEPAPAPPAAPNGSPMGPGENTTAGFRVCQPNDNTPVGAVVDGYRKTSTMSLFGMQCRWEPVGR